MNRAVILSLEGNIAAGKTTFLKILEKHLNIPIHFFEEPVKEWQAINGNKELNLLNTFYQNPER